MDPLVFLRVANDVRAKCLGTIVESFHQDGPDRFRLIFAERDSYLTLAVSLRPGSPWIGRPLDRQLHARRPCGAFAAACARAIEGSRLEGVGRIGWDRILEFRFANGPRLILELAVPAANLLLLNPDGTLAGLARHPKKTQGRLAVGAHYAPPELPRGRVIAGLSPPEEIDHCLARASDEGEDLFEALRRRIFGVGSAGARLLLDERARTGSGVGILLQRRLAQLSAGEIEPVVSLPTVETRDLRAIAEEGGLPDGATLLPWSPATAVEGIRLERLEDPLSTAGAYHEALERSALERAKLAALRAILRAEERRALEAEQRAREDFASFESPDRHRHWAEALLAGAMMARRAGSHYLVPDPYDAAGAEIAVPARAGLNAVQAAEDHFRSGKRARRGLDSARARIQAMKRRGAEVSRLLARFSDAPPSEVATLERAMRDLGLPVGLKPATRAARATERNALPRLEGVRLYTTRDGFALLAGKTGRDNDRLTFKLASPEDFWFHIRGMPGAHVVLRNPGRASRPSAGALLEAAAVAAWYSNAKSQALADVQWTRRKYVRRARGAAPGTVLLKRSETVRVKPGLPPGGAGEE